MRFGNKTISKRKVAFIAALLVNALVSLGQQIFMLQMFFKNHNGDPPAVEYIKITLQHTIVFLLMALCIYFWQQETFWSVTNLKQSVCFYSILILFTFTIPVFTLGEHVSSNVRQTFLMSVTSFCYI